jgi:hypothetical protein
MSIVLKNSKLRIDIDKPGQNYRASRFDWTGKITQVTLDNKYTFCTEETLEQELLNIRGRGLYNEFGINGALGYEECRPGKSFTKIGIGLLKKENELPYDFFKDYKVTPFKTLYKSDSQYAIFVTYPTPCNGYAVELTKNISLNNSSFTVFYNLKNTGEKPVKTNEYCHNFLAVNRRVIDMEYKLHFPFNVEREKIKEFVDPDEVLQISHNDISWKATYKNQFFLGSLEGGKKVKASWALENSVLKVGIRESGNFVPEKINLWGNTHVVSPEIFIKIDLTPGKSMSWVREYEVYKL